MPTITGLSATGCAQLFESIAFFGGDAAHPSLAKVDAETLRLAAKTLAKLAEGVEKRELPGGGDKQSDAEDAPKPVTEITSQAQLQAALDRARSDGRAVVLDFFAPWCKPCVRAMPRYVGLAEKHANDALWLKLNIDVVGEQVKSSWNVKKIPKFAVWREGEVLGECGTGYHPYFNSSLKLEEFVDHILLGGPDPAAVKRPSEHVIMVRSADALRVELEKVDATNKLAMIAFCHGPATPEGFAAGAKEHQGAASWIQVDLAEAGIELAKSWGAPISAGGMKFAAWQSGDRIGECGIGCKPPFTSDAHLSGFVGFALERSAALKPPADDAFGFDCDF